MRNSCDASATDDLDEGDVVRRVGADQHGLTSSRLSVERDGDGCCISNNMSVGEDLTICRQHDPRACRFSAIGAPTLTDRDLRVDGHDRRLDLVDHGPHVDHRGGVRQGLTAVAAGVAES